MCSNVSRSSNVPSPRSHWYSLELEEVLDALPSNVTVNGAGPSAGVAEMMATGSNAPPRRRHRRSQPRRQARKRSLGSDLGVGKSPTEDSLRGTVENGSREDGDDAAHGSLVDVAEVALHLDFVRRSEGDGHRVCAAGAIACVIGLVLSVVGLTPPTRGCVVEVALPDYLGARADADTFVVGVFPRLVGGDGHARPPSQVRVRGRGPVAAVELLPTECLVEIVPVVDLVVAAADEQTKREQRDKYRNSKHDSLSILRLSDDLAGAACNANAHSSD